MHPDRITVNDIPVKIEHKAGAQPAEDISTCQGQISVSSYKYQGFRVCAARGATSTPTASLHETHCMSHLVTGVQYLSTQHPKLAPPRLHPCSPGSATGLRKPDSRHQTGSCTRHSGKGKGKISNASSSISTQSPALNMQDATKLPGWQVPWGAG